MIRQLAVFVLAVINFITPTAPVKAPAVRYPSPGITHQVIEDAKKWTVLISGEGWDGWDRGTGVLLDSTHVLTCRHVAAMDEDNLWVYFYPGYYTARGKMTYSDTTNDLAILEIDVPAWAKQYAQFTTAHYDGEPITAIGNAQGSMQWFVTYGIISSENRRDLYTDGQIYAGDSGGPWINDKGEIVALTDWGEEFQNKREVSGGIASHTIYDFLTAYKKSLGKKK